MHSNIVLSAIYVYPVKSLSGIRLTAWPVTETGFKYDRKWMLIDKDHIFLSQRRLPRMALINTEIAGESLMLTAPGMEPLALELEPQCGANISATVWHDQVDALAVSDEADEWFSRFLQMPCRLVYQNEKAIRQVDQKFAKPDDKTAFSDGFPFLLVSESSLVALNKAMELNLHITRFRPNLVLKGCDSYAEDTWREISIGAINFRLPKPCSRCAVPTIDPDTAETGKEPLTTLNRLRKWENKVYFGQNAIHDHCGKLAVDDPVIIRRSGAKQPPL